MGGEWIIKVDTSGALPDYASYLLQLARVANDNFNPTSTDAHDFMQLLSGADGDGETLAIELERIRQGDRRGLLGTEAVRNVLNAWKTIDDGRTDRLKITDPDTNTDEYRRFSVSPKT